MKNFAIYEIKKHHQFYNSRKRFFKTPQYFIGVILKLILKKK